MHAAANARAAASLQWTTTRLSELFADWARAADDPAALVWLTRSARHLQEHAARFAQVRPDSVLLAGSTACDAPPDPPDDRSEVGLAALAAAGDPLATAAALLARLETQACELRCQCDPHADGALARALDFLMIDLKTAQADRPDSAGTAAGTAADTPKIEFRLVARVGGSV